MKDPGAFDFDRDYGRIYDRIAHTVIPGYEQVFQAALALLGERLAPDARLLVVGCGTGAELVAFGRGQPGWRLTGVDPSERMIRYSARAVRDAGLDEPVRLHHGLVSDLSPEPGFDAATVINVVHFLPDSDAPSASKAGLLRDVALRLREGAPVILFDLHGDPGSDEFRALHDGWEAFMRVRGLHGPDLEEFLERLARGIAWVSRERLLTLSREAGLEPELEFYRGFLYGGWLLRALPHSRIHAPR